MIERKKYLERLIARKENGLVKVITGIRRCGKSYLLFNIYKSYLRSIGVEDEQIICLALDDDENIQYRNPLELGKYIRSMTTDESKTYYVFLDEIQKVVTIQNPYIQGAEDKIGFVDVVLGLMKHDNIDVYVTGSNSKMLTKDVLTVFRGRGDEVRVYPISFKEYYAAAELFLFPSLYDNAPLVVREAAALHTPAVMAKGSTASAILTDGVNGFLVDNDPDEMAALLRSLSSDRERIHRVGLQASRSIVRSWEDCVDEVLRRYNDLLSSRGLPLIEKIED